MPKKNGSMTIRIKPTDYKCDTCGGVLIKKPGGILVCPEVTCNRIVFQQFNGTRFTPTYSIGDVNGEEKRRDPPGKD